MSSFEKNLSEGNVAKQLVLFSLPFLASNIIPVSYTHLDGRCHGCQQYAEAYAGQG